MSTPDLEKSVSSVAGITTTLAGIVTVTTSAAHGLAVGNKIKISGVTGTGSTIFNSDFIVYPYRDLSIIRETTIFTASTAFT